MINKNLKEFLQDIANSELKGNVFAWVVANYFDKISIDGDKESFYESIVNYYSRHREDKAFPKVEKIVKNDLSISGQLANKDFRIKSIRVANVRGIEDVGSDGLFYGFDLFKDNTIKNAVILGPNAVGKSSIYSALEFVFANRIGEAELRTTDNLEDDDSRFKEYLQRFKTGFNSAKCIVNTNSGVYSLQKPIFSQEVRNRINPKNHFVSDFDIYDNGRKNYSGNPSQESSFHFLVAKSLGFQEYLNFNQLVSSFSKYKRLKEKKQVTSLMNDKTQQSTDIKNWSEEITTKRKQVTELSSDKDQTGSEFENKQQTLLSKLNLILSEQKSYSGSLKNVIDSSGKFRNSYNDFISQKIDDSINLESDFLQLGIQLANHTHTDNCPFCKSSKNKISEILQNAEKRLGELKDFRILKATLNTTYTDLILNLTSFYNQLQIEKRTAEELIEDVKALSELSELMLNQTQFIGEIQTLLAEEPVSQIEYFVSEEGKVATIRNAEKLFQISNTQLLELLSKLDQLNTNNAQKKNQLISDLIGKISSQMKSSEKSDRLAILNSEINKLDTQIKLAKKRIVDIENDLKAINQKIELFNELQEKAAEYSKIVGGLINRSVTEALAPIEDSIKEILSDYLLQDENTSIIITREPMILSKDDDTPVDVIVAKIKSVDTTTGEIVDMSPNQYFNTFRYKLFSMMVSCSIAIASRKNTGINLPLVLDDVFYASDYLSKATFVAFLNSLIKIFKKHSPELPLQFILFTHDDMIFRSAMDALDLYDDKELESDLEQAGQSIAPENKVHPKSKTVFGRLFSPDEKDKIPSKSFDNSQYWNLLFMLPLQIDGTKILSSSKTILS